MSAPPCPQLAAELTDTILDNNFTQDIPTEEYQVYIWVMSVVLRGGWVDLSDSLTYGKGKDILRRVEMLRAVQPWLEAREWTQDEVTAHLVDRQLFDQPLS